MGVHQAKIKRALPWVFVAAMVTALLRGGDGQAAKRMWSAEELRRKGKKFKGINAPKDALTGEILPPYQSKKGGKPRSFNSDETKRVKSLKSSLENAYGKVHDTGHIWNPEQLRYEVADYGQWQSNLKAYTVCDGDIVFRNSPGMLAAVATRAFLLPSRSAPGWEAPRRGLAAR
tara:strand:- start:533 stop:1054 length:522 start_codon:yes stop_codon:yes gene_type:complete